MSDFLQDLLRRRGLVTIGGNPNRFIELTNGQEVPISFWELDATTSRTKYYYNSRMNKLFLRVQAICPTTGNVTYHWKDITEY